ncbi:MAG: ABC transporter permease [Eubacteriales bacterium]|nr:ABC transporter permease [Eubacteriales bacterium]
MNVLYFIVQQMMYFAIPLLIVALGGMFSERSGIINIALEGIMVMGGFSGVLLIHNLEGQMSGQGLFLLGILVAGLAGGVFSLLHAYASINLGADQTISGTALNLFAPAFAIFTTRAIQRVQQIHFTNTFFIEKVPLLGDIPVLGALFFQKTYLSTYLGLLIFLIASFVIKHTRFGLRLRACGEHPQAADSVGVNVYRIRYAGVFISGVFAGIGGLIFVIPNSVYYNPTVNGYGFLALAVLIFGNWRSWGIFWAALFFSIMKTFASVYSGVPFLRNLPIPQDIYNMIPYIATLAVLAIAAKHSQAPRAEGIPFEKGSR